MKTVTSILFCMKELWISTIRKEFKDFLKRFWLQRKFSTLRYVLRPARYCMMLFMLSYISYNLNLLYNATATEETHTVILKNIEEIRTLNYLIYFLKDFQSLLADGNFSSNLAYLSPKCGLRVVLMFRVAGGIR